MERLKVNHIELECKLNNRIIELEPLYSTNFIDYDKNKKKIEFMRSHTNEINLKMKEMIESINLMKNSIEKLNQETQDLK